MPQEHAEPDYSRLEKMLFQGFLTRRMSIGRTTFVFKTLNQREKQKIHYITGGLSGETNQYVATLIAHSVLMCGGVNVLPRRDEVMQPMIETFQSWTDFARDYVLWHLSTLNQQALELVEQVKPYTYGPESDFHWSTYREVPLNDVRCTGIPGTERLALNTHQKLWTHYCRHQQRQDAYKRQWSLAKFQASAWNPKGMKKIDRKEQRQRKKREKRQEALYKSKGQTTLPPDQREIKITQDSKDELLDQMRKDQQGVQDPHDQIIAEHERRIREAHESERDEWRKRQQKAKQQRIERMEDIDVDEETPFAVFDPDQVQNKVEDQVIGHEDADVADYRAFQEHEERLQKWGVLDGWDGPEGTSYEQYQRDLDNQDMASNGAAEQDTKRHPALRDHLEHQQDDLASP